MTFCQSASEWVSDNSFLSTEKYASVFFRNQNWPLFYYGEFIFQPMFSLIEDISFFKMCPWYLFNDPLPAITCISEPQLTYTPASDSDANLTWISSSQRDELSSLLRCFVLLWSSPSRAVIKRLSTDLIQWLAADSILVFNICCQKMICRDFRLFFQICSSSSKFSERIVSNTWVKLNQIIHLLCIISVFSWYVNAKKTICKLYGSVCTEIYIVICSFNRCGSLMKKEAELSNHETH